MQDIKKKVNAKPAVYATHYPELQEIAHKFGYALTIHGSLQRDMDLVAIPWVEKPKDHLLMLEAFIEWLGFKRSDGQPYDSFGIKPHGRVAYTIANGFACYLDISIIVPEGREIEWKKKTKA